MADGSGSRVVRMARTAAPDRPMSVLGLGVIALVLAADQATKAIAERRLPLEDPAQVLPMLSLNRVHNTGIAFSMLSSFGSLGLIVLTLVITVVVFSFWQRAEDGGRLAAVGYALIIGGALGNLIDRLAHSYVVDFLMLHIGERVLFVFNLADVALTMGPIFLILAYLVPAKRTT
ncbi:MAG: signal peptidase II [Bauldia sp.]